jgi:hypothetical protein
MFWPSSKEGQGVNVLKPNQRATVVTLLQRNTPQREIARITGIDRKTIRSYHPRWLLDLSNSPGVATGSRFHMLQPVRAKSTATSLRPKCFCAAKPWPFTKTWTMPAALTRRKTASNALCVP